MIENYEATKEESQVLMPALHNHINRLLIEISAIQKKYESIAELTGENFNLFRILRMESSEVRTHSALIAELLNPKGSHGQKDIFLKLFIKSFCFRGNAVDTESSLVTVEKHIGYINDELTEGGRIDILITDKFNNQVLIENKIYAGDEENQLVRYSNYAPNADLIYLTLDGIDATDFSKGTLCNNLHYKCLSYGSDILNWLEECRKEVAVNPIIRESITQYINLIKYLTNQSINQNMEKEIIEVIQGNWQASFALAKTFYKARNELIRNLMDDLNNTLKQKGLKFKSNIDLTKPDTGISIYKEEWQNVNIGFGFLSTNHNLIYGFCAKNHPKFVAFPQELRNVLLNSSMDGLTSDWWPWHKKIEEPFDNWDKPNAYIAMQNGSMKKLMLDKIEFLLNVSEGISGL